MIVKGTIEINSDDKTTTIHLENGSYGIRLYPIGMKHFLEEEIECLKHQQRKELHEQISKLCGFED